MYPMLLETPMRSSFPKLQLRRIRSQAINDAEDLSSRRDIDGTIYTVEPEAWVSAAMDRLTVLCALKPNWDEGTAAPVHPDVYEFVHRFLADKVIQKLAVGPDIVPTVSGGIQLEWHTEEIDFLIGVEPEQNPTFYFFDSETNNEVESSIADDMETPSRALVKLGLGR